MKRKKQYNIDSKSATFTDGSVYQTLILQLWSIDQESVTHPEPQISQESFKSKGHLDCDPAGLLQSSISQKKASASRQPA